jgi:hypothetical protein
MTKVFFGGSRSLSRLNQHIKKRASNVIDEGFVVLVGDANGADKAIQKFFADRAYPHVIVFHTGTACRNNLGNWSTRSVAVKGTLRDFNYYAAKDLAMSREANYGFMIWDGESAGTINNVLNLVEHGKKVVIHIAPRKEFLTLRTIADAARLVDYVDPARASALDKKVEFHRRISSTRVAIPPDLVVESNQDAKGAV